MHPILVRKLTPDDLAKLYELFDRLPPRRVVTAYLNALTLL